MTSAYSTSPGHDDRGSVRYLVALREHWLLIAVLAIVAVVVAGAYSFTAKKRYEAEADLLFTPVPAFNDPYLGFSFFSDTGGDPSRSLITVARLIETTPILDAAANRLGPDAPPDLGAAIKVEPVSQSNILSVTATAGTPDQAAAVANAFADAAIEYRTQELQAEVEAAIARLESRLGGIPAAQRTTNAEAQAIQQRLADLRSLVGAQDPTLQVANRALPPRSASWPKPKLSMAVAFLAALLLGIATAVTLETVSPRVKREDEILLVHRLPILARVPRLRGKAIQKYLTGREPLPADVWESYRTLRASLAPAGPQGRFPRSILVTSAIPAEGKTMTAVNLAITMALAGIRVILVDGDLRRPMVAAVFGVPAGRIGLAHLLMDKVSAEQVLVRAPGYGDELRLLPASPEQAYLIDLLEAGRVERALAQLQELADVVVVDSPPLTEVADALPLAEAAEAVIVAVRLEHSRRDRLGELRQMLAQVGIVPTGAVVTMRTRSREYGYHYRSVSPSPELKQTMTALGRQTPRLRNAGQPARRRTGTHPEEAVPQPEQPLSG